MGGGVKGRFLSEELLLAAEVMISGVENNWQRGSSAPTKAGGPKYGGDCLCWESASFLPKAERAQGPGRKLSPKTWVCFLFSLCVCAERREAAVCSQNCYEIIKTPKQYGSNESK